MTKADNTYTVKKETFVSDPSADGIALTDTPGPDPSRTLHVPICGVVRLATILTLNSIGGGTKPYSSTYIHNRTAPAETEWT